MVLTPHEIEPPVLKVAGFNPIITSNVINKIKKKRMQEKNKFYAYNGFNLVLGSIPRLSQ